MVVFSFKLGVENSLQIWVSFCQARRNPEFVNSESELETRVNFGNPKIMLAKSNGNAIFGTIHHEHLRFVPQIWFLWSESMPSQWIVEGF